MQARVINTVYPTVSNHTNQSNQRGYCWFNSYAQNGQYWQKDFERTNGSNYAATACYVDKSGTQNPLKFKINNWQKPVDCNFQTAFRATVNFLKDQPPESITFNKDGGVADFTVKQDNKTVSAAPEDCNNRCANKDKTNFFTSSVNSVLVKACPVARNFFTAIKAL